MTGQSSDAAERSAHVTRGPAAEGVTLHPILERKNEKGQTTGQLRVVVELQEEIARLRAAINAFFAEPLPKGNYVVPSDAMAVSLRAVMHLDSVRGTIAPTPSEDAAFLDRLLATVEAGDRVTEEDVARLRRLANWADAAPPPSWNGTLDKGETRKAVEAARKGMSNA